VLRTAGIAAVALTLLAAAPATHACDLDAAPSARWSLAATGGGPAWLVTPCGDRFFSLGVNAVAGEVPARELPDRVRYDWRRQYSSFGDWVAATRSRLAAWGFNTEGGWSLPPPTLRLPAIVNLELGRLAKFHWSDPFDPATETAMREQAAALTAPYKGSPYRIGYFSDNEVGWWGGALFSWYSMQPAENHTKQRWIEMLRAEYGDEWSRFAADFVPPPGAASWDALLAARQPTHLRAAGQGIQAVRRWTGIIAEHYYAMVERTLREADPDALIFGDRLPIYYDPTAVRAMARHVDAIATNYNVDSPEGWIARYYFDGLRELSGGKPVLISEWFYAARENRTGNRNNGHLMTVDTQAERAEGAATATRNFAAVPEIVGMHWFQYADHPKGGRGDGEDYNFGLVDIDDRPYEALTAALAAAHRDAPRIHAAAAVRPSRRAGPIVLPAAATDVGDRSLRDWPKPSALLPPLTPAAGEAAFGETYMTWDETGLSVALIGQDYYDIDLFAYDGAFPLGESFRIELGVDAGAGPRRFLLAFVPPRTKVRDHPPMTALLCGGEALPETAADCRAVDGARAVYFGADQPRITAEAFLPWSALGLSGPPPARRLRIEVAGTAWHRSRWMSLSGLPPTDGLARPDRWTAVTLGGGDDAAPGRPRLPKAERTGKKTPLPTDRQRGQETSYSLLGLRRANAER
jgi:hypothetical protein